MQRPVLQIENDYVLALVQALYGAVSANVRAVNISSATESGVVIHILLEDESADDREDIDDIAFEFEALFDRPLTVAIEMTVGTGFEVLAALPGRGVYHRKEDAC